MAVRYEINTTPADGEVMLIFRDKRKAPLGALVY